MKDISYLLAMILTYLSRENVFALVFRWDLLQKEKQSQIYPLNFSRRVYRLVCCPDANPQLTGL